MNTFSFLIAFSAIVCSALANPAYLSGNYYGKNIEFAKVNGWEEPCGDQVQTAKVQIASAADLPQGLQATIGSDAGFTYNRDTGYNFNREAEYTGVGPAHYHHHHGYPYNSEKGEILIHRPAPIIVRRPPTKVLVNHPPLVVKPAPVVLHRPPPLVVRPVVTKHHPQQVKVEPVYVKVVKPTTSQKIYLDDKHQQPYEDTYYAKPHVAQPCD